MRGSTGDDDGLEVGGMDGGGKGEGFVDGVDGGVGDENGLVLIPGICWLEGFEFGAVTLMRLVPFVGARKTRGTSCGRQMSDIVVTA